MDLAPLYQLDAAPAIQRLLCCPSLDLLMEAASTAGEGWSLALLAMAIAWKVHKARRAALRSALRGLASLGATGVLVVAAKQLVRAPRPLQVLGAGHVRVLLEPLRAMSFPSGHSAAAAALAMWAWSELPAGVRLWPWALALLCGLSRVYVGAHWTLDVVAGWSLGVATAAMVGRAWPRPTCAGAMLAGPLPVAPVAPAAGPERGGDPCL